MIVNINFQRMADSQTTKKTLKQQKKQLLNTINEAISPVIKNLHSDQSLQMPDLALHCAQFFHSISRYCLQYYRKHNQEQQVRKTKMIKKVEKQKKEKENEGRIKKRQEEKGNIPEKKPQPPKKPLTAYILYFQDQKPNFVERYPSLNLSELTKLIAKQWKKELSEDQKNIYKSRATEERKRYEQELQEFKRTYGKLAGRMMSESQTPEQEQEIQAIINAHQMGNIQGDSPKNADQLDPQVQIEEISDEPQQMEEEEQAQVEQDKEGQEGEGESSSQVVEVQNDEDISSQSPEQNGKDN